MKKYTGGTCLQLVKIFVLVNLCGRFKTEVHDNLLTRRLIRASFIIFVSILMTSQLLAQNEQNKYAAAEKFVTLLFFNKSKEKSVHDLMQKMIREAFASQTKENIKKKNKVSFEMDKVMKSIMKNYPWEKMKREYASIYTDTFSLKELNELINFYKSPIGCILLEKQNSLIGEDLIIKINTLLKKKNNKELTRVEFDKRIKAEKNTLNEKGINLALEWLIEYDGIQKLKGEALFNAKITLEILMNILMQEFTCKNLRTTLLEIYSSNFSCKEIQGLLNFYNSSIGYSFLAEQATLADKTQKAFHIIHKDAFNRIEKQLSLNK